MCYRRIVTRVEGIGVLNRFRFERRLGWLCVRGLIRKQSRYRADIRLVP